MDRTVLEDVADSPEVAMMLETGAEPEAMQMIRQKTVDRECWTKRPQFQQRPQKRQQMQESLHQELQQRPQKRTQMQ